MFDMQGQRYGRLLVQERAGHDASGSMRWHCSCDCGGITTARRYNLVSAMTQSCGCLRRDRTARMMASASGNR